MSKDDIISTTFPLPINVRELYAKKSIVHMRMDCHQGDCLRVTSLSVCVCVCVFVCVSVFVKNVSKGWVMS